MEPKAAMQILRQSTPDSDDGCDVFDGVGVELETNQEAQLVASWLSFLDNDGVEALGLDFSVMERVVNLIPNGRNIEVTDATMNKYLERKFDLLLLRSVADQLYVFCKASTWSSRSSC
ncbi:hypothetical protein PHYPSEUDO_003679 [Phytophthora pseudosyringae]|uniref:HECT domain-containing protein n=1 Tax=Phytophthora pseudosyringae TaxID=221518 RepID=A0A8T1VTM4_9STRA|nr:hypothetical protein PHYPSEUDO_003679 [Phytophthora pseudosyringae]